MSEVEICENYRERFFWSFYTPVKTEDCLVDSSFLESAMATVGLGLKINKLPPTHLHVGVSANV